MKLTVCIPTHNSARFLSKTLGSILGQTFRDFECLVVDDCSADETVALARSVNDDRVRVFPNPERLGFAGNCRRCLQLARGEYLCVFGHDDLMHPDNLERKVAVLDSDRAVAMVHSAAGVVVDDGAAGAPVGFADGAEDYVATGEDFFQRLLFDGNCVCASSVVSRRETLRSAGGFGSDLVFTCDYEAWMRLAVVGRVAYLARPLLDYRWHAGNLTQTFPLARRMDELHDARRRAVTYFRQVTGRSSEADVLDHAVSAITRAQRWAAELAEGKAWLEQHYANLEKGAQASEEAKAWLEDQRGRWERRALADEDVIRDLQGSVRDLERVRQQLKASLDTAEAGHAQLAQHIAALEQRVFTSNATLRDLQSKLAALEASRWVRLGRRLKRLVPGRAAA